MNIHNFSPYIHLACRSILDKNVVISTRVIYDYELIYLESGEWNLIYNSEPITCKTGDVILLRPGIPHSIHGNGKVEISQPHIHFDIIYDSDSEGISVSFKDTCDMTKFEKALIRKDILPSSNAVITIKNMNLFMELFFNTIDEYSQHRNSLTVKATMLKILELIISNNFETKALTNENIIAKTIKSFIDHNYENNITLESLSLYFNYNKYYISKLFKETYGVSPIKHYNDLRLNLAKKLLLVDCKMQQEKQHKNERRLI